MPSDKNKLYSTSLPNRRSSDRSAAKKKLQITGFETITDLLDITFEREFLSRILCSHRLKLFYESLAYRNTWIVLRWRTLVLFGVGGYARDDSSTKTIEVAVVLVVANVVALAEAHNLEALGASFELLRGINRVIKNVGELKLNSWAKVETLCLHNW